MGYRIIRVGDYAKWWRRMLLLLITIHFSLLAPHSSLFTASAQTEMSMEEELDSTYTDIEERMLLFEEELLQLKRDNYNLKLEDCVVGADQQKTLEVIGNQMVPRTGLIFLTPRNHMGRAPFYSCEKIIGSTPVKTLWFNMGVLLLMGIIVTILLLTDTPGRYLRN